MIDLKNIKSDKCDLISLYIPEKDKLCTVINMLENELSIVSLIKEDSLKNSISNSLKSIIEYLKTLKKSYGMAIFAQNGFFVVRNMEKDIRFYWVDTNLVLVGVEEVD